MKILLIPIFFLLCTLVSAQFNVDLGKDTTFCRGLWLHQPDTSFIGANVVITGGSEPYSYSWSCKVELSESLEFYASDFLNDTTLKNPYFIDDYSNNYKITFNLEIVDSNGAIAKDSINIRFSRFGYAPKYYTSYILKGDSTRFTGIPAIGGGIEPLSYFWYPTSFISDSTDLSAYTYPNKTTEYSQYVWGANGCKSDTVPFHKIYVDTITNVERINDIRFEIYTRKGNTVIYINSNRGNYNNPLKIMIYGLDGRLRLSDLFKDSKYIIDHEKINAKIAIIQVTDGFSVLFSRKVLFK